MLSIRRNVNVLIIATAWLCASAGAVPKEGYKPNLLGEVLSTVKMADKSRPPVVIFDLDDTIFNARSRTFLILKDFVKSADIQKKYPHEVELLKKLEKEKVAYQLTATLKAVGIDSEKFTKEATDFWVSKFFSNEYCHRDELIPGAVEYVQRVRAAGARIVYLTGRDLPRMEKCTIQSLKDNKLPHGADAILYLKPSKDTEDLAFKKDALENVRKMGPVVACFDNEPGNVNAMKLAFPDAKVLFLDTAHSGKTGVPDEGIAWVLDFKLPR